jgi:o-succinylbenzoate synthase
LLAEKVGGKPAHELPCGVALGIPPDRSVDTLRRWIAEAVERGYRRVKIKVAPGWDAEPVAAARDALSGTELPLTVDANGGYEWPEHQGNLRALDAAGLLYIEQPLHPDELLGHARLAKTLHTQVCLDETLRDARAASQVVEAGGPLVWNVKVHRMGGLSEAARVVRIGLKHGARLWAGTMPESGLGSQAAIAAAALPGFVYPSDLEPSARWFGEGQDVIQLNMSPAGTMRAPECSIAALLDEERFHATAHRVLNLAAR